MSIENIPDTVRDDTPGECYVCLESCRETSPCVCGAPLHRTCLTDLISRNNYTCSICKTPFRIVYIDEKDDLQGCHECLRLFRTVMFFVIVGIAFYASYTCVSHQCNHDLTFFETLMIFIVPCLMTLIFAQCNSGRPRHFQRYMVGP